MPTLKPIIARRFPASKIVYGEFITGLDNKMRYFKPLRIALYRQMAGLDSRPWHRMSRFISVWKTMTYGKKPWDLHPHRTMVWGACWTRVPLRYVI
jgi:hypothetical protein